VSVPDGAATETEDDPAGVAEDAALIVPTRIAHWARVDPRRPFLVEVGGAVRSYGEVHEGIMRWASVLVGLGVQPGDRVVSLLPPSVDAHLVWLASACIGALEVSVNPELRGPLLDHVLTDASPRLCVVRREQIDLVPAGVGAVVVEDDPASTVAPLRLDRWPSPSDAACVLYTSGTTGPAKGVIVAWGQLSATIGRIPRSWLSGRDAVYAPWPMFHVTGRSPLPAMADVGGRVVLRERLSIGDFWSDIVAHGCTSTTVGAVGSLIAETTAPSGHPLRWVFMAPRGDVSLQIQERFGVRVIGNYGSTELGFPILNRSLDASNASVAGWPRPGYQVKVVDAGVEVPAATAGEMWIKGPVRSVMFSGYLGVAGDPLADGWFRTGDLVTRRADGAIVFVDRLRDVIRRFGENISSVAVEAVVRTDPDVGECAAVSSPSDVCGEEVLIVVTPAPGRTVDAHALFDRLRDRLPRYALPAYVAVREVLPTTPTGKVAKHELAVAASDDDVWESPAAARRHPRVTEVDRGSR
jgi:crotonobetaine/carnitine-CoA ligase